MTITLTNDRGMCMHAPERDLSVHVLPGSIPPARDLSLLTFLHHSNDMILGDPLIGFNSIDGMPLNRSMGTSSDSG